MAQESYGTAKKLSAARAAEFSIVDSYKYGYRNREDITNLPAGVLIKGSQNVQTNVSERIQIRQGYSVDGQVSSLDSPILGSFDYQTRGNDEVHLRSGFLSAGNDAKVQYRYVDSLGVVTWRDLLSGISSSSFNFTSFWRTDENLRVALFCNGDGNVYEWNGAVTTLLSATSNTITKNGTDSWEDAGFYVSTSPRSITINGVTATYTGGETTTTLTGVSVDFSASPANSVINQTAITTAVSTFTGPPATFDPNLISVLNNQIYLGSTTSSVLWLSKVNSYTDYSNSTPRQPGEGGTLILDENLTAFVVQGVQTQATMYISAGKDIWYQITFTAFTDQSNTPGETIGAVPIKIGQQQGAISQAFVSNMKNYVITATNETTIDLMGVLPDYLTQTQVQNISDPIKLDIDSYDFTDGSIFYYRYYIYVAIPKEGLVLSYNLTSNTWDAPATIPISRFYIVEGELYGHSYNTSESYQLFTGYADRVYPGFLGYPIPATMAFSYENYGTRHAYKSATALYVEGYISPNTTLNSELTYELDGCATMKTLVLDGSNKQYVCIPADLGSLGKQSLGKQKLGGGESTSIQGLPPKFRWEPTFSNTDFFECSVSFSILGVNQNFQLLAFGLNIRMSTQESINIRD